MAQEREITGGLGDKQRFGEIQDEFSSSSVRLPSTFVNDNTIISLGDMYADLLATVRRNRAVRLANQRHRDAAQSAQAGDRGNTAGVVQ